MKKADLYHKWVEWSDEDRTYIGKCPDLLTGIHGEDPIQLYAELCEVVEEVIQNFEDEGRVLPAPKTRPMQEVA
jgi:predicted RNase H-like HicB family nuclease